MVNQEIKNLAKARSVANQLKDDLLQVIDCFTGYVVAVKKDDTYYQVEFYSDSYSNIITDSVFGYVYEVVQMYKMQYSTMSYWLGTKEKDGEVRCAMIINVYWKK